MQKYFVVRVCAVVVFAWLGVASAAFAQDRTVLGTVAAVEPSRIQVRVVDETSKREEVLSFAIGKDTRIKRGDSNLSFADAKIANGERVAILVNSTSKDRPTASEIRLAAVAKPTSAAKPTPAAADPHAGHQMPAGQATAAESSEWMLMQDGVIYGLFNQQGGPRGGREFVVPNWWMGMATKEKGRHTFGLNAMFSLDPATVGDAGYREIFQVGEALDGKPLIDHQHPHDFVMQLAASWRMSFGDKSSLTFAGGPAGEPTLGPVAFMHRASAAGLVLAPLGHHTFDSTHISYGVVTAAFERGPVTFEASAFNGREPDEHRWNVDFGAMDSVAARIWFRPNEAWEAQVSTGFLREPEELVPGDARRTTASISWLRQRESDLKAVTVGYGVNSAHDERRHGLFGEFSVERGRNSFSGRVEFQQVETEVLLTGEIPADEDHAAAPATVAAVTLGGARRLLVWKGWEGAIGAHVTFYGVPNVLEVTHSSRPVSFQVFLRLRLPTLGMGRMWNTRMSQGSTMGSARAGHVMR
jgi:hypothetical protein